MGNDTVKDDIEPYLALWHAVLERAVNDAFGSNERHQQRARNWILSDESSFSWVCDMLQISFDFRLKLRELINES